MYSHVDLLALACVRGRGDNQIDTGVGQLRQNLPTIAPQDAIQEKALDWLPRAWTYPMEYTLCFCTTENEA